jgi:hypothetical protein
VSANGSFIEIGKTRWELVPHVSSSEIAWGCSRDGRRARDVGGAVDPSDDLQPLPGSLLLLRPESLRSVSKLKFPPASNHAVRRYEQGRHSLAGSVPQVPPRPLDGSKGAGLRQVGLRLRSPAGPRGPSGRSSWHRRLPRPRFLPKKMKSRVF